MGNQKINFDSKFKKEDVKKINELDVSFEKECDLRLYYVHIYTYIERERERERERIYEISTSVHNVNYILSMLQWDCKLLHSS